MKTNLSLLKGKALGFFLLIFAFCSLSISAQTTIIQYNFQNDANALIPTTVVASTPALDPDLKYYNSSGAQITPTIVDGMLQLNTSLIGSYLELTFNATNFANMNVEFYGEITDTLFGSGNWTVTQILPTPEDELDSFNFNVLNGGVRRAGLNANASNNSSVKVRISAKNVNGALIGTTKLRLDNLKITYGNPNITVYKDSPVSDAAIIPNNSEASESFNTVFNSSQTLQPGQEKTYKVKNFNGTEYSTLNASDIRIIPSAGTTLQDFVVTAKKDLGSIPRVTAYYGGFANLFETAHGTFNIQFTPQAEGLRSATVIIYSNGSPSPYSFKVIGSGRSCSVLNTSYIINTMDPTVNQTLKSDLVSSDFVSGKSNNHSPQMFSGITTIYPNVTNGNNLWTSSDAAWFTKDVTKERVFGGDQGVDISQLRNVSVEFNVAAFANSNAGSSNTKGVTTTDYIILSIPDGNGYLTPVMQLNGSNSGDNNKRRKYVFNTSGKIYSKTYALPLTLGDPVSNPSSNTGTGNNNAYSRFKFDIPLSVSKDMTQFKFSIKAKANADAVWLIDDVRITSDNATYKTWDGSQWTPTGRPKKDEKVIFNGAYDFTNSNETENLEVCECEVNDDNTLSIPGGKSLTVRGKITNKGDDNNVLVASDANLIQIEDAAVNTGNITALRNMTPRRNANDTYSAKEYSFYSSPVYGQNMKAIFGGNTDNTAFALVLNEPGNNFVNANAAQYDIQGKGFAVKDPTVAYYSGLGSPATVPATFKGVPNNKIEPLAITKTGTKGWNLIGNPYPSNLDLQKFYNDNKSVMESTIRFWDKTVNNTYAQYGGAYNGYSYALYNAAGNVGNPAPGGDDGDNTGTPGGTTGIEGKYQYAKVGQGFLVRSSVTSGEVHFKNTQRSTQGDVFFGRNATADSQNLFRLQLITPGKLALTQSFVYLDFGTNGFGVEDTGHPSLSSSDTFYSYANDDRVIINGRGTFDKNDVVNLGTKNYAAGLYKIRAIDQEGIFANGQHIYLKDKVLNVIADLTEAPYEFSAETGEFTNRFEIVYEQETVLGTTDQAKASIELYRDGQDFVVQTSAKKIVHVELYDMSGRLMFSKKANAETVRFTAETLTEGIYILKGQLEDGEVFTKKLRK